MLAEATIIGFVPVGDFAVAEEFYANKLGFPVQERDGFALVLRATGGVTIRCVLIPDAKPAAFTILGWEVAEIHTAVAGLRAAGVEPAIFDFGPGFVQDQDGVWAAPGGAQVVWFRDPFGNVLSLSQHSFAAAGTAATEADQG